MQKTLGAKEHRHDILEIIGTIPGGKLKQIVCSWVGGLFIAMLLSLPVIIRISANGRFIEAFAVVSGVIFLPSFATFMGEFSKSSRAFEMLFILITYFVINGVTVAMYMGNPIEPSLHQATMYLASGVVFGIVAIFRRRVV